MFNGLGVFWLVLCVVFVFEMVVWSLVGEVSIEVMCLYVVWMCVMSIIKLVFIFDFLVFKNFVMVIILFVFICVIVLVFICSGGWMIEVGNEGDNGVGFCFDFMDGVLCLFLN